MTQPVRLDTAVASPKVATAVKAPEVKLQVLQPKLATDVRTLDVKVEIKAEAV